jgi:hypothetical protein
MYIQLSGTGGGTLVVPGTYPNANKKLYFIYNSTSSAITVKVSGQTGVSVPAAAKIALVCNGSDIVVAENYMVSPVFAGTPTAPTATLGTNTTQIATTAFVQAAATALSTIYPVGCIFTSTVSTSPATLFGFGTWVAFGAGRVLIGDGGGYSAGATGGSADAITVSHTHTFSTTSGSMSANASHQHGLIGSDDHYVADGGGARGGAASYPFSLGGSTNYGNYTTSQNLDHTHSVSGTTASAGSSGTGANLQPYVVVYMWNRTA